MADDKAKDVAFDIQVKVSSLGHVTGFGPAGSDPAYVPDREVFDAYTHQQIWDQVRQKLDPGALGQIAAEWKNRADKLNELFTAFSQEVKREFTSWSGTFAGAAQKSTDEFVSGGNEAHTTATAVQQLMSLNSESAQTVKASIPPPPPPYVPDPDPVAEAADGGARLRTYQNAAAAAQADAQDTMNFVYNPTQPASGDSVPRFMPPPPPPGDQPGPGGDQRGSGGTGSVGSIGNSSGTSGTDSSRTESSGDSGEEKPGDQPASDSQQPGNTSAKTQPSSTGSPAATTTPSSLTGGPAGLPGDGSPVLTTPSSTTSAGAGGGHVGSSGPGGIGVGGPSLPGRGGGAVSGRAPGRSVPGQPVPTTAPVGAPSARLGQMPAGAPGMPMGSVPQAGRGKDSDEERTKSSPEYLRRRYEELSSLDPSVPPVLGGDAFDEPPLSHRGTGSGQRRGE
ncbi:hypothetical protein [Nocardia transvalensis]|uniref:hypothetical protein n=1 Tax=Nocardia transvalensis TaxID=37333 RepID=UPI0018952537|nr:hypothetical protein [Nocardia transvalensis]MBF6331853.1 hypothetical protein [Nocardia transvalensis]